MLKIKNTKHFDTAEEIFAEFLDKFHVNCHGCKWLDRYKKDGNGYCCMVERSKTQREKVRRPDMERCELYKPGDFNARYRTEVNE